MPADKLFMGGSLTAYNVKITDDASIVSRGSTMHQLLGKSVWRDGATPIPYAYL